MEKICKNIYIISGKGRQGKDSLADAIIYNYNQKGLKAVKIAYAFYIKEYVKKITGWDGNEATKETVRNELQQIGTDIVRNEIDEDFFVKRICDDIKVYSYFFDAIIITDARFENEIEVPKKLFKNITLIHIEKDATDGVFTEKQKQHASETSLDHYDKYDYEVKNNGTIEDLRKIASIIIEEETK